jgi:hypothetical protein
MLTQPANEVWHTLIDILRRHQIAPLTPPPQEIRAHLRTMWEEQKPRLRTQWGLSQTDMADLTQAVETGIEHVQDRIPRLPDVLLDDTWKRSLESLSQALEQLAVAYGHKHTTRATCTAFPAGTPEVIRTHDHGHRPKLVRASMVSVSRGSSRSKVIFTPPVWPMSQTSP